jgi:hemerythrin superfamily protein
VEKSIFHALMRQHRNIERLFENVQRAIGRGPTQAAAMFAALRRDLLAHAKAEQIVVYPRFHEIPGLAEDIETADDEHADVERMLAELGTMAVTQRDFAQRLADVEQAVVGHVADEEGEIFRIAKLEIEPEESVRLAAEFIREYERHGGDLHMLELPSRNASSASWSAKSPSYRNR